jgi:streptogramin lyase
MGHAFTRVTSLLVLSMVVSLAVAPAVLAAAPTNDTYTGRTTVASLPYSDVGVDTTEATTDADDAEANFTCGAPATDASVWYEFVGTGEAVAVDVSTSDYPAGVLVETGSPGSFVTVSCGPGGTAFFADLGTTYAILVIDDQTDLGGNGGTLNLTMDAVEPASLDLTLNQTGRFHKDGSATVSGTVTCEADFATIFVSMSQQVGRLKISGEGGTEDIVCDGDPHSWSVEITSFNGLFRGGKAKVHIEAFACTFECASVSFDQTIRLKK